MLARQAGIRPTELVDAHLLAAQLRRRAPPLPRDRGPRVDDRRRGRGPGPGQARLRARARSTARPARSPTACSARRSPTGKRVRSETAIAASRVSRLLGRRRARAARRSATSPHRHVLILGAGETARADRPRAGRPGRAHDLRRQPPPRPRASRWRSASAATASASTTCPPSSSAPTSSSPRPRRRTRSSAAEELAAVMRRRDGRPLLLIDLAVPRDIEPDVRRASRA